MSNNEPLADPGIRAEFENLLINWIKSRQLDIAESEEKGKPIVVSYGAGAYWDREDGTTQHYYQVVPYFVHQALLGLLKTNDPDSVAIAEDWIKWYLNHMRPDGTIFDHWYTNDGNNKTTCIENPRCVADSKKWRYCDHTDADDSYASTFLAVVNEYRRKGGSLDFLRDNFDDIIMVAQIILDLQDPEDGLTWNLFDSTVERANRLGAVPRVAKTKYLMDNVESWMGLKAMAELTRALYPQGSPYGELESQYQAAATQIADAIEEELFNPSEGIIKWAKSHSVTPTVWYQIYTTIWPQIHGLIDPGSETAQNQVETINANWDGTDLARPDWKSQIVDLLYPAVGYAALLASYTDWAKIQTNFYYSLLMPEGHTDNPNFDPDNPKFDYNMFRVQDAGWLLQTLQSLYGWTCICCLILSLVLIGLSWPPLVFPEYWPLRFPPPPDPWALSTFILTIGFVMLIATIVINRKEIQKYIMKRG